MIVVGYYGFTLVVRLSLCQSIYHRSIPPSLFLFPDDNLIEYQWIFTKLGVFIHNVEGVVQRCRVSYVTGATNIGLQLGKACCPCSR